MSESSTFDTTLGGIFCLHDLGGGATVHAATNMADRVGFIAENDSETGNPVGIEGFIASRDGGFGVLYVSANLRVRGVRPKGTDKQRMLGAVVGKALEPLNERTGLIQVLVTLQ